MTRPRGAAVALRASGSPGQVLGDDEVRRVSGAQKLGRALLLVALFTLPWNAVQISRVPLGDVPLGLAAIVLAFTVVNRKVFIPAWFWFAGPAVLIAGAGAALVPPTSGYLAGRFTLSQQFLVSIGGLVRSSSNLSNMFKYELAIVFLPLVVMMACAAPDVTRFARQMAAVWVAGVTISALIAFTDDAGITQISERLIGFTSVTGRQAGLTNQPNAVGVEVAMALPVILLWFTGTRRSKLGALAALAICLLGFYESGSRGAAVGLVVAVLATLAASQRTRRWTGRVILVGVVLIAYLFLTGSGQKILSAVRLASGGASTEESNLQRTSARLQGWHDFVHSPFVGLGWGYANDAHLIYLQLLAAGGVVALIGVLFYVVGTVGLSWRKLRDDTQIGAALIASVLTWLILGLVENQLTDQWIYVPLAILLGMLSSQSVAQRADPLDPVDPIQVVRRRSRPRTAASAAADFQP